MRADKGRRCSCGAFATGGFARTDCAQATLEYALTMAAIMAIVVALAALWRAGENGALAQLVEQAASHVLAGLGVLDIALY